MSTKPKNVSSNMSSREGRMKATTRYTETNLDKLAFMPTFTKKTARKYLEEAVLRLEAVLAWMEEKTE